MATQSGTQSNHLINSIMTKGVLGGSIGLITKGILSDAVEFDIIIRQPDGQIRVKRGKVGGYYDKDYWKKFRKDLEENDEEIEVIKVKIRKKDLIKKYKISVEHIVPKITAELISYNIIEEGNIPKIEIELLENEEEYYKRANITASHIKDEGFKINIKDLNKKRKD